MVGDFDGRIDHLFFLHWIRFRLDGGGGGTQSAARFADRDHRYAGGLHDSLYWRRGGAHGCRAVATDAGRCGSGGEQFEVAGDYHALEHVALGGTRRAVWGDDGDDFVALGFSVGTGTGLVFDVARRAVAEIVWTRASAVSDARYCYLDRRICGGHSGWDSRYWDAFGSF